MLLILGILQEIEATNILPAYKLQKARIIWTLNISLAVM
jgi:hypothetical protein